MSGHQCSRRSFTCAQRRRPLLLADDVFIYSSLKWTKEATKLHIAIAIHASLLDEHAATISLNLATRPSAACRVSFHCFEDIVSAFDEKASVAVCGVAMLPDCNCSRQWKDMHTLINF